MTGASDGPGGGPGEQPVPQTGRPPVPRPLPSDAGRPDRDGDEGSWHVTEQVPFPLPPLPPGAPEPVPGPATGQLDLGGYPPRVPGPPSRRPAAAADDPGDDPAGSGSA